MLVERFQTIMAEMGPKTAVICDDEHMSYAELDDLSGKVAAALHAEHISRNDIVPVLLARGTDYIAAVLGILKAGAGFICLNEEYPQARIDYIRKDCAAKLIIDHQFMEKAKLGQAGFLNSSMAATDIVMMVYTSGSTGNPKGIILQGDSVEAALLRIQQIEENTAADIHASVASFSFVAFLCDVILPLYVGETVVIFTETQRRDLKAVEAGLAKHKVTCIFLVPSMLYHLDLTRTSLKMVLTSGEALCNFCGCGYRLLNVYGMSEMPLAATYFLVERAYDRTPIGKPAAGLQLYLLNEAGEQVPPGEDGEICIAGSVASGYIHLPELTAQVFTANPFSDDIRYQRLLHTGDIGRMLPDGNYIYVNRKDWQVKINGQRVETGEIEVRMQEIEAIDRAVVLAFKNNRGQDYLCAFYTTRSETVSEAAIKDWLAQCLPEYMIPLQYVPLAAFPVNQNGKLDRKSLKSPGQIPRLPYVAPATPLEQEICTAYAKILRLDDVSREENFFDLGGDSLASMELVAQLQECGLTIQTAHIYSAPTPHSLAELIESKTAAEPLPPLLRTEAVGPFPMSDAQIMMARFGLAMERDGVDYRQADIDGWYGIAREKVDYARLSMAIDRTRNDFEIFQLGYDLKNFTLLPEAEGALQLILEDRPDMYRIHIKGSHLLMDEEFSRFILQRLQSYYQGEEPVPFVRFRDYVHWLDDLRQTHFYQEAAAYYQAVQEQLRDYQFIPHPTTGAHKWKGVFYVLTVERPQGVDELMRRLHCSEYIFYLSQYMRILSERQQGLAGCFSVLNMRMLPELTRMEGCGTNRFYLCLDATQLSLEETAAAVYDRVQQAMRYVYYPAWRMLDPECEEFPYAAFNYTDLDKSTCINLDGEPISSGHMSYSDYFDIPLLLGLEKEKGQLRIVFLGREDMTNVQELSELAARFAAAIQEG